jgi:hypothetical protein
MYHEGLRHLSTWWRDNAADGVQERDLALALVALPAKEKGHDFLDWFADCEPTSWQIRVLRRMARACEAGLFDSIRDLPDEQWEYGVWQVLPHLSKESVEVPESFQRASKPAATVFHEMMLLEGLKVDEVIAVGVLQGVRPRTSCLMWYDESKGQSGSGWPIPLLEKLATAVFHQGLLEVIEVLPQSSQRAETAMSLVRNALEVKPSCGCSSCQTPKRSCCE